jgi:glycosyltransferase involved in cell wall biosynthesis
LFQTPTPIPLIFFFLPIRSVIILLQIFYHTYRLKNLYGPFDIYFTVNAFTAWVGNLLRKTSIVNKTVFWVWDYYPPIHENKIIMFMRWLYWQFDKKAIDADNIVFLNERLYNLRRDIGILPSSTRHAIVPIGTNPKSPKIKTLKKQITLTFIGAIKKSQGLDAIFDYSKELHKAFPNITLHILGGGPDENYYKMRAKQTGFQSRFFGYIPDDKKLAEKLSHCDIGIALYTPDPGNVSYYGDPSKIKMYLSAGLPVITTDTFSFSQELKSSGSGILVAYGNIDELIRAIKTIKKAYKKYQINANKLAKRYKYTTLYHSMFKELN